MESHVQITSLLSESHLTKAACSRRGFRRCFPSWNDVPGTTQQYQLHQEEITPVSVYVQQQKYNIQCTFFISQSGYMLFETQRQRPTNPAQYALKNVKLKWYQVTNTLGWHGWRQVQKHNPAISSSFIEFIMLSFWWNGLKKQYRAHSLWCCSTCCFTLRRVSHIYTWYCVCGVQEKGHTVCVWWLYVFVRRFVLQYACASLYESVC